MTHALTWKWTLRLLPHTTRQTTFLVTLVAELHLAAGAECSNGLRVASSLVFMDVRCITADLWIPFVPANNSAESVSSALSSHVHKSSVEMYA